MNELTVGLVTAPPVTLRPPVLPPDAPRYVPRNLSVLAYAQGFTLWHYRAPDLLPAHAVEGRGYFDGCDMIAQGDLVLASGAEGFSILFAARVFDSPTRGSRAIEFATLSIDVSAWLKDLSARE